MLSRHERTNDYCDFNVYVTFFSVSTLADEESRSALESSRNKNKAGVKNICLLIVILCVCM